LRSDSVCGIRGSGKMERLMRPSNPGDCRGELPADLIALIYSVVDTNYNGKIGNWKLERGLG
jgi:hypothetical protein